MAKVTRRYGGGMGDGGRMPKYGQLVSRTKAPDTPVPANIDSGWPTPPAKPSKISFGASGGPRNASSTTMRYSK